MSEARRRVIVAGHTADTPAARAGLHDPDPVVRAAALGALHRTGALDDADVAAALVDPSAEVRRRAAALSPAYPSAAVVTLLDDPDPVVAEMAAWACGERLPAPLGVVAALARTAGGHDDPLVREAAVAALGAAGDDSGLGAVLAATTDRPAVRRRAVIALAAFEGDEVDAALQRALHDTDWQVRQAAEELLGLSGPRP